MTTFEFVLLLFGAVPGHCIEGRTKLQKVAYFLGLQTGVAKSLGYRPYFYGPYSAEVAEATSTLIALDFIKETQQPGPLDDKGFERKKYRYELTADGIKAVDFMAKGQAADLNAKIKQAIKKLNAVVKADYVNLSYAAKVFWLTKGQETDAQEIGTRAESTGWHLDQPQIAEATGFLKKIKTRGFQPTWE